MWFIVKIQSKCIILTHTRYKCTQKTMIWRKEGSKYSKPLQDIMTRCLLIASLPLKLEIRFWEKLIQIFSTDFLAATFISFENCRDYVLFSFRTFTCNATWVVSQVWRTFLENFERGSQMSFTLDWLISISNFLFLLAILSIPFTTRWWLSNSEKMLMKFVQLATWNNFLRVSFSVHSHSHSSKILRKLLMNEEIFKTKKKV